MYVYVLSNKRRKLLLAFAVKAVITYRVSPNKPPPPI